MPPHCTGALDLVGGVSRNGSTRPSRTTSTTTGTLKRPTIERPRQEPSADFDALRRFPSLTTTPSGYASRGGRKGSARWAHCIKSEDLHKAGSLELQGSGT